ncbi:MAG: oligosaccharide flippase family protein [Deltaproteobacteria bacterium]|nr:oligosaccharide flippase family protein [Deltaproteobacteria bacterium]
MSSTSGAPEDLSKKVSRAVAWVGAASAAVAVIDAITLALLLAFWVTQADVGVTTLAVTLFYFLDLATEAGLGSVIIQKLELDEDALSSVFWLNVMISGGLFLAMLGIGPLIGWIQGSPVVGLMLIVYATKLLYQNVYFVPAALLRKELRFKELSMVRTVANFGDVAGRIGFAAAGEPVWCFVAGPLVRIAITGIGLQIVRPWRPRFVLHLTHAREWLVFAGKTASSQALQHLYNNIGYQIVGGFFGDQALGAYRVAYELVLYPVNFVSNIITQVAFPAFARLRHNRDELAAQFFAFSRQNLAMVLPILVVIAVSAPDILALAFSRVTGAATPARILCLVGMLRAVDCLYLPLLDGVGVAGRNTIVALVAALVLTACDVVFSLALGPSLGFVAVAVGRIVGYPLVIALHASMTLTQLGRRTRDYVGRHLGILACGAVGVAVGATIAVLMDGLTPAWRLPIVATAALGSVVWLLSATQGLGPLSLVLRKKS